ncbi:DNA polymerase/3'-5' exonuclease PolX [Opitutales bacterium ASA1]|uniref:DNA polymerase/3'-5' exonuclease PolX n=1 Tax=Congregicoccus parvus TaxID=3081749 RepID=UPI002B2F8967|nr:DNA polymerase/3'-5' exonuclease PolX [Opitutales bacterium ASA1]
MNRSDIAAALEEIALLLELQGENPFKVRAYQNGARTIETLTEDLDRVIAEERLAEIKGIGDALAKKILELHGTGRLEFLEKQRAAVPPGLIAMMEIPGMGAKKVRALHTKLGVDSIDALAAACRDGRVATLDGFGEKTQQKILDGIKNREAYGKRHLWWDAFEIAEPILAGLRALPAVRRAEHAGSLRRNLETVGDLDFIVAAEEPASVMAWFTSMAGVVEVTAHGETKSSVRLAGGIQADLRVVPEAQFVFALHHFTGSKEHNVLMRQRALARGWSLSEWGLTIAEGKTADSAPPTRAADEAALFAALGLAWIPPELREGSGEIEAAERGAFPRLIETADLRGSFHNHTTESDGRDTLVGMVAAAGRLGWEYLGIADHSKASFQANGLSEARVLAQLETIRRLNASGGAPVHVFAGIECDILADGRLDLPDEVLAQLDYVVVSVHNALGQPEDEMTRRIVRAVEHPLATMLGHATGRLLLAREPSKVDLARVIDACAANDVIIELNANPRRLDLDWRWWRRATEKGVLCSINPDAHAADQLGFVDAGVRVARKGWITPEHVINTLSLEQVRNLLLRRKS